MIDSLCSDVCFQSVLWFSKQLCFFLVLWFVLFYEKEKHKPEHKLLSDFQFVVGFVLGDWQFVLWFVLPVLCSGFQISCILFVLGVPWSLVVFVLQDLCF